MTRIIRQNSQPSNKYFSVRTRIILIFWLLQMLSYGGSKLSNIIRVVKYEYDELFKLWIWVKVSWYWNKYLNECIQVSEIMSMIRIYSSFWILIADLWCKYSIPYLCPIDRRGLKENMITMWVYRWKACV